VVASWGIRLPEIAPKHELSAPHTSKTTNVLKKYKSTLIDRFNLSSIYYLSSLVSSRSFLVLHLRSDMSKMAPSWTHLVRFIAEEDGQVHLGQVDETKFPDVGIAMLNGEKVTAKEIKGSIFDGVVQDRVLNVAQVLLK
jgi:hypothetical protein